MAAAGRSFGEQMSISDVLVYLGMADVDSCFHRIRTSESLGQYSTFPCVFSARELGIVGTIVRGAPLVAESQINICCAALPMGFGCSLYLFTDDTRKADVGGRGPRPVHISQ